MMRDASDIKFLNKQTLLFNEGDQCDFSRDLVVKARLTAPSLNQGQLHLNASLFIIVRFDGRVHSKGGGPIEDSNESMNKNGMYY